MKYSATHKIDLPVNFPDEELAKFINLTRKTIDNSPAWTEFAGASNLIAWRFRSVVDDWHNYQKIEVKTHEDIYQQERLFFNIFTSEVSCIESATYAIAAVLSHDSILNMPFGVKEQKACDPKNLHACLSKYPDAKDLAAQFKQLIDSNEWALWLNIRNRLSHRSNLPKRHFASVGMPEPTKKPLNFGQTTSTKEIDSDFSDFDALITWLSDILRSLLSEATELLKTKITVCQEKVL